MFFLKNSISFNKEIHKINLFKRSKCFFLSMSGRFSIVLGYFASCRGSALYPYRYDSIQGSQLFLRVVTANIFCETTLTNFVRQSFPVKFLMCKIDINCHGCLKENSRFTSWKQIDWYRNRQSTSIVYCSVS